MFMLGKRLRKRICVKKTISLVALALAPSLLIFLFLHSKPISAQIAPDQTLIPNQHFEIANPSPVSRDFQAIQKRHKVLVGVIDSGIDYNHPRLTPHLHFSLNEQGEPIGFGHDYVGKDRWAAPFLIQTKLFDPEVKVKEKKKIVKIKEEIEKLAHLYPELERFSHPYRDLVQESILGAYHGTHVAGLASYDRPEIGIIGYRVLPLNRKSKKNHSYERAFIEKIISAIHQAAADGVRIVSMSLKDSYAKTNGADDDIKDESAFSQRIEQLEQLKYAMDQYPDILFVASTGNNAGWSDQESRYQFPCGLELDNLLCVGAINEEGRLTNFTDIPLNDTHLVFALGHQVISTIPEEHCVWKGLRVGTSILTLVAKTRESNPWLADALLDRFGQNLKTHCGTPKTFAPLSGTSMSAPLVSRIAADFLIKNPELSGFEVIQRIYQSAYKESVGRGLVLNKLRIRKPSWYVQEDLAQVFSHHPPHALQGLILKETEKMYWEAAFQKDPKSDP